MDVGLKINISANVVDAIRQLGTLNDNLEDLAFEGTGNMQSLKTAIADLKKEATFSTNVAEIATYNRAIKDLSAEQQRLSKIGLDTGQQFQGLNRNMGLAGLSASQTRIAFLDLGRSITGQGFSLRTLASNFALLGPGAAIAVAALYGVFEVLNKQTDAEKKAAKEAEHLKEVLSNIKSVSDIQESGTGSVQGDIAKVEALASVIQNTNAAYKDRQHALEELRQTNKAYFGDLTLEAQSLATLKDRVNEYSSALVNEAVIKGQVEEIANLSRELEKQKPILKSLSDAYQRQSDLVDSLVSKDVGSNNFGQGGDLKIVQAQNQLEQFKNQFLKQNDAVATLTDQINRYKDALNASILDQTKLKPLKEATGEVDKSIEGLLEKIIRVREELGKPVTAPIFKQFQEAQDALPGGATFKLFEEKIALAIKEGNKIGTSESVQYAQQLADLYRKELLKIQNPNLRAHITLGTAEIKPEDTDKMESGIEKAFGAKNLKLKVPVDLAESIRNEGFSKGNTETLIRKASEDALNGLPPIRWSPEIQIQIDQATLKDEFKDQLNKSIRQTIQDTATSGLENIGKSIGAAFAKGANPILAAGQAIVGVIGDLIEQMGQSLIKYGAEVLLLKEILSISPFDLSPGVAIAAGIGMVAIGELLKKSFKATPFAEGGIVTGPTLSLIGEVPGSPEAVLPLNRIGDFLNGLPGNGGEASGGTLTTHVRGQDLLIVMQRAQKNRDNTQGARNQ